MTGREESYGNHRDRDHYCDRCEDKELARELHQAIHDHGVEVAFAILEGLREIAEAIRKGNGEAEGVTTSVTSI